MKKLSLVALLIPLGIVSGGFKLKDDISSAPVVGEGCRVTDPSGTPLNVRSAPKGGSIRGAITNDTIVKVLEVRGDWARIKPHSSPGKSGWVYSKYLDCSD
jgi:hypothetical protein